MAPQTTDRPLPAMIAWPLMIVNILLVILTVFNLVDHFQSAWSVWLSAVAAVADLGLALAVFVWLKRQKS